MISEYMFQRYSTAQYTLCVPLGSIPEELQERVGVARAMGMLRPYRPEVDAVVVLPKALILVEAKVWNIINGLAKLPMYKSLVRVTPELQDYKDRKVLMQLVVGWTNPNVEHMAKDAGVEVVVFCPPWLSKIVDDMQKYWTKEYRSEREQKLSMREYLGVD
jgi:hypothetical protein